MATTPSTVFPNVQAVQYTGENSGEIAALIPDFTVTGETATELTFTSAGATYTVPRNGYITYAQGAVREAPFANEDDFRDAYASLDQMADHVHELKLTTGPALAAPAA